MIITLAIILFVLLALINKKRGIKAFLSLFINYIFIIIILKFIGLGINPILIALVFSIGASAFILFFINGINNKTKIAYIAVVFVLLAITGFIIFIGYQGSLNGFGDKYNDIFYLYSPNIHVNLIHTAIAVLLISLTGAITDTALDVTTTLHEVYENNKGISFLELMQSGKNMGADILGTMVNTLFFVFIGEFMGFFIVYHNYHQSFATMINDKLFLQEVSQLLMGNLGCILIIPVTMLIQSYLYTKENPFAFLKIYKN